MHNNQHLVVVVLVVVGVAVEVVPSVRLVDRIYRSDLIPFGGDDESAVAARSPWALARSMGVHSG